MRIVCDIYKISKKEMEKYNLYYENRIIFYNSKTRKLIDCALSNEDIHKYKVGQIIED